MDRAPAAVSRPPSLEPGRFAPHPRRLRSAADLLGGRGGRLGHHTAAVVVLVLVRVVFLDLLDRRQVTLSLLGGRPLLRTEERADHKLAANKRDACIVYSIQSDAATGNHITPANKTQVTSYFPSSQSSLSPKPSD